MTVPGKPLVLRGIDPATLTLGELALFNLSGHMTATDRVDAMTVFLIEHSDWTKAEVYAIQSGEMKEIAAQVGEKLRGGAVPLAKAPRSRVGRGKRKA